MSSNLTNLPQLTAATNSDWLYIVDVSDTTDNPAGSSKKILRGDLYAQITGFTYLNNAITLSLSDNSTYQVVINTMTGLTINGVLSATTYANLPLGVWTTGSTGNYSIKAVNDSGLDATGNYAVAEGYDTLSSGYASHAEGYETTASEDSSHAEGDNTMASGYASHAEGNLTKAIGSNSHAEGGSTTTIGENSHAEGQGTISGWKGFSIISVVNGLITLNSSYGNITSGFTGTQVILDNDIYTYNTVTFSSTTNTEILLDDTLVNAGGVVADLSDLYRSEADVNMGDNSHAEGSITKAIGQNSHAEGDFTKAIGYSSHAEGGGTIASGYASHAEGGGTRATNFRAHAEGYQTTASGVDSHAEGSETIASGNASHAEGFRTSAIGDGSHTEGADTKTIGNASHAEGYLTTAIGDNSHAEGGSTTAIGEKSHAEGTATRAYGGRSHAEGATTQAGFRGFSIDSIVNGLVTLDSSYGNVTSEFISNQVILTYGLDQILTYNTVTFSSTTNTQILLDDISINDGFYIADLTRLNSQYADFYVGGGNAHSEGSGTIAIGNSSHAEGGNTIANGSGSHAEGKNTTASGEASHAEGFLSIAQGDGSHAEGGWYDGFDYYSGGTALGKASHAEGVNTTASGLASHTEGRYTTASGYFSHSEGHYTTAFGSTSHTEGYYTTALGDASHVEGTDTVSGSLAYRSDQSGNTNRRLILDEIYGDITSQLGGDLLLTNNINRDQPILIKSTDVINITFSSTTNTEIFFSNNINLPFAYYSDCLISKFRGNNIGDSNYILGDFSHAEGEGTNAFGYNSHAEGLNTNAIGYNSHAEGEETLALGRSSHAGGDRTTASGSTSFIHSSKSFVLGDRSVVLGGQNITGSTDDTVYVPYFNIQSATTDNSLTEILVIDTNGDVKKRTVGSIGFTGGTVSGATIFTGGLSANTFYATTYYNLPLDVFTTGGTYDNGTITFTNNSGGTFNVSGLVTGDTYWTSGSTGNYSIKAKNNSGLDATGNYAVAEGYNTKALGDYSHTEGQETIAGWKGFSIDSVVNGLITLNSLYGDVTSEFFSNTVILDNNLYTFNTVTFSSTTNTEILLDNITINSGAYVTDLDNLNSQYADNRIGDSTHAEGYNTKALGSYSHTEGNLTTASGEYSHAEGSGTIAGGNNSHAEGQNTTSAGDNSHAEGGTTQAIGTFSHAEGSSTIASGESSHSEGDGAIASGNRSHAGGYYSTASGETSFIHSYESIVLGDRSVVLGGQGITGSTNDTVYVPYFNIQSATTDNTLTDILVKDINGDVKTRDINTIGFTGGTVSGATIFTGGLSANTFSATTYYNLPLDVFTTGGTYNNTTGIATFTNNSGGTFDVSGFFKTSDDTFTTGFTFNVSNYDLTIQQNNGQTDLIVNLGILSSDVTITGGTYNPTTGIAEFTNNTGGTFSVSGFLTGMTDTYVSGFTYSNNNLTIKQTAEKPDLTVNIDTLTGLTINGNLTVTGQTTTGSISATTYYNLPQDIYTTGGTYNNTTGVATFTNNSGGTFNVSGFFTGSTDNYTTGYTYSDNTFTIKRNNGLSDLTTTINTMTGLTINGNLIVTGQTTTNSLSASTITATTITADNYENLPFTDNQTLEIIISGGSEYAKLKDTIAAPSGGARVFEGNVVVNSGFTANTISATTYYNLPASVDTYTTGFTFNVSNYDLTIKQNNGQTDLTVNLGVLSSDVTITGGTYNSTTGVATFTNNTGGTFNVSGFLTGMTDTYVSGFTYSNNNLTIKQTADRPDLSVNIDTLTGLTINGNLIVTGQTTTNSLSANTITATTITADNYENLPFTDNQTVEIFLSGGTEYLRVKDTISAPSGGTRTFEGDVNVNNGFTANTISATTYYNLPASTDTYTTGGTYNNTTGVATFTNNSGGTFNVSGFYTGSTDNYTTGYTYDNNTFTIKRNNGLSDLSATINTMTGLTINGDLTVTGQTTTNSLSATTITATTITATDYQNLPFTDNQTIEGFVSGSTTYVRIKDVVSAPSGGTRTFQGNVVVNGGFTANTISATTYYNLPASVDTFTTGFTFNVSNYDLTIKQNNGQTDLTVNLGVLSSDMTVTGGTYNPTTGIATFTNNTGGTFDVSGFLTGMTDTYVSGFTYSDNNLTIKQTAGKPDLSVNIDTLTGLTINGNLTITGQTTTNSLSANTISATTYYNLPMLSGAYLPLSGGTVTGGTSFTNGLTANTISATTLQFDTTYTGTVLPGQIAWDSNFGTLQQGLVGGNVTQKIGETSFAMVKNVETTTINKGQVVYVFGATGDKISVKLASNTGDTTSSKTLGIAAEDIAVNQNGLIITQGTLDGLNLGSYTAGDILWLSSTPGQFTTVKQYAPSHLVFIGVVQRANNGNGQIYVKPQNGYEIDELHNVLATGATYGDLLVYSAYNGSDIWVNTKTLTGNYVINGNLNVTGGTQSIFSGKVGVGLNNPVSQLHVRSTAIPSDREIIAQFDVSDDSSYFRISNVTGVDGNFIPSLEGYNSTEKIAMYFLAVGTTDTGTESLINFNARIGQALVVTRPLFKWSNYDSTKMTMLANGNLGIGTETPSYKLDVSGTTRLKGVSAELTIDDATWAELKYGTDNYFRAQGDQAIISGPLIRLFDGSQETMRITGGNVSIGTTVTSPTARLHVNNTGSTNSFLVEDDSNPDSTPFVIDNTGNVGIGTTTPTAKLHVSGDTRITGTLTATTISATTYQNLPKVAFSPINVGVCDTAPTAASTQYYYQTIGEVTTTLSKVKLWGFSGSDLVLFGIYRGTLGGSMTLIGQASGTCTTGPNELTLTAETGQNLTITAGEDLVVGYYPDGTSWRTIYDVGISDINFGITNTTNITSMPATPTGTATAIRFACTLY